MGWTENARAVRQRQKLIDVLYYSFDGKIDRGQLVIDRDLEADIQAVLRSPGTTVSRWGGHSRVPPSLPKGRGVGRQFVDGRQQHLGVQLPFDRRHFDPLQHAYGRAIDINPVQNPYVNGEAVAPRAQSTTRRSTAR